MAQISTGNSISLGMRITPSNCMKTSDVKMLKALSSRLWKNCFYKFNIKRTRALQS